MTVEHYYKLDIRLEDALGSILDTDAEAPIEILNGAIIHDPNNPGMFIINANTAGGLRKFGDARELNDRKRSSRINRNMRSVVDFPVRRGWIISEDLGRQENVRVVTTCNREMNLAFGTIPLSKFDRISIEKNATAQTDKTTHKKPLDSLDPTFLLCQLRGSGLADSDRRYHIIAAELAEFDPDQTKELKSILLDYIGRNRDSIYKLELVAVASAIRKYVAILDSAELGEVATLLEAGHRASVPPEIELEIAKMVVRKLTANPAARVDPYPVLADRLMEIAGLYLNARMLPRPNYGAIALNATLGLVLLGSRHLPELFDVLRRLPTGWFKQQLGRRAAAIGWESEPRADSGRLIALQACLKDTGE